MEGLIEEAEQFVWGGPEAAEVPALCGRLREARAWVAALNAALKSKPSLESLEPLLAWDPPPVHHAGPNFGLFLDLPSCACRERGRHDIVPRPSGPAADFPACLMETCRARAVLCHPRFLLQGISYPGLH